MSNKDGMELVGFSKINRSILGSDVLEILFSCVCFELN